jgi:hypothetical protein
VTLHGVDKDDAAELQSEEARMSGHGRNEKGGLAAQAQSIADKENFRVMSHPSLAHTRLISHTKEKDKVIFNRDIYSLDPETT